MTPTTRWSEFVSPRDSRIFVDCWGLSHQIEVLNGKFAAPTHGKAEQILEALGGSPPPCKQIVQTLRRAPQQIIIAEVATTLGKLSELTPRLPQTARFHREEPIDPTVVPWQLRRVSILESIRERLEKARSPKSYLKTRIVNLAQQVLGKEKSEAFRWRLGADPGLKSDTLILGYGWLRDVFVLGLEDFNGAFTLSSSIQRSHVELIQISESESGEVEQRELEIKLSKALPGDMELIWPWAESLCPSSADL